MEQLIKALPSILQAAAHSDEVTEAACIAAWNQAVGEGLRGNAVPMRFEDKKLIVAVADAIWQKQLQTMLGPLFYRLNSILGQQLITSIELRVEPAVIANSRALRKPDKKDARGKSWDDAPEEVLTAAGKIEDLQLRRAYLAAARSCLERLEKQ